MVEPLERLVVDVGEQVYPRMFAWWTLLTIFATLRFDDHRGLSPTSLTLTSAALTGVVVKTPGAGKARQTMPLYISAGASITGNGWLRVGLKLWEAHTSVRDFFLLLPSPALDGVVVAESRYTDAVAMSRAVLNRLKTSDGEPLFVDPQLVTIWSEHSERATLPSWCACIPKFPSDWVDVLGRWGATRGEAYVRTHKKRVAIMQAAAVEVVRSGSSWTRFDEETTFMLLERFLQAKGGSDVGG